MVIVVVIVVIWEELHLCVTVVKYLYVCVFGTRV